MQEMPRLQYIPLSPDAPARHLLADMALAPQQLEQFEYAKDTVTGHLQHEFLALRKQFTSAYPHGEDPVYAEEDPSLRAGFNPAKALTQLMHRAYYEALPAQRVRPIVKRKLTRESSRQCRVG